MIGVLAPALMAWCGGRRVARAMLACGLSSFIMRSRPAPDLVVEALDLCPDVPWLMLSVIVTVGLGPTTGARRSGLLRPPERN